MLIRRPTVGQRLSSLSSPHSSPSQRVARAPHISPRSVRHRSPHPASRSFSVPFRSKKPSKKATLPSFASFLSPLLLHPPFSSSSIEGKNAERGADVKEDLLPLEKAQVSLSFSSTFSPDRFGARSAAWGYRASECERSSKKPAEKLVAVSLARPPLPFSPSLSRSRWSLCRFPSLLKQRELASLRRRRLPSLPPFPPRRQSFLLHGGAVFSGMGCVKNRLYVGPAV